MAILGTLMPYIPQQWFDNAGVIGVGLKVFTYAAGTTTKQTTWSDAGLSVPNSNPIILNSAGRAAIFLNTQAYKFVLAPANDTDPPTSPLDTLDNIVGIPLASTNTDITDTIGDIVAIGNCVYLSDGSGGKTAGSWYLADNTNAYSSSTATAVGFAITATSAINQSGTIRTAGQAIGFSGLTPGSTYYISTAGAIITGTIPVNARQVLIADSTTTGVCGPLRQSTVGGQTFSNTPQFYPGSGAPAGGGISIASGVISAQVSSAGVGNVGAGETSLFLYSLPGNSLNAAGKSLRITTYGQIANNAAAKTIKIYFGAVASTLALQTSISASWYATVILSEFAVSSQIMVGFGLPTGAGTVAPLSALPSENLIGAVIAKVTGTATTNNDILCNGFIVEVIGA